MEVTAYNSEKYERDSRRYIMFSTAFTLIIVITILSRNFIGAIVLFFLLGGYLFFNVSLNQLIKISITPNGLIIGAKMYERGKINGYALEIDPQTHEIKNIIFIAANQKLIHTFEDDQDTIKKFIINLNELTPMIGELQQTLLEKVTRKFKL